MPDTEHIEKSQEAGWLRRNFSLPAVLTLLFVALLLGGAWWWRSQGIKAQVEAAGGAFHVHDPESNVWARMISRIEGRPSPRSHVINFRQRNVDDRWLRGHREQVAALSYLTLNVAHCPVTDEGLQQLRDLSNISGLTLAGTEVTDAGMEHVATLSGLQLLDLSGTKVTVSGIEQLSSLPNLQRVQLQKAQLHDSDLTMLQQFPRLTSVLIDDSLATEAGIAALRACPQLVHFDLVDTTDDAVLRLSGWVQLERLYVSGPDVTDASIPALAGLNSLTSLHLRDTSVSDAGLAELQQALPGCEVVRSETPPLPTR